MACLASGACKPGVSTSTTCASGRDTIPRMRCRVVCGRGAVILTFCPTSALTRVDLPTLGRPNTDTVPARKLAAGFAPSAAVALRALGMLAGFRFESRQQRRGGRGLGRASIVAAALAFERQRRRTAAREEGLGMIAAGGAD